VDRIKMIELLDYEIRASWWACWVSWSPLQEVAGWYFSWKVKRKYNRYLASLEGQARVKWLRQQIGYKEEG
jgi:hypothetical protein